jgi:serine/threonine protein kinase
MHRDIKPENMVINKDGNIQICDLEVIKEVEKNTQTRCIGTEGYLAPELSRGDPYDESVDMWALGITILQMYSKIDIKQMRSKQISILEEIKKKNESLYHICNQCLQEDPMNRISSHGVLQYIDSLKKKEEFYVNPSKFYLYKEITENFQNNFIFTQLYNHNNLCENFCTILIL